MPHRRFFSTSWFTALVLVLAGGMAIAEASENTDPQSVTLILDFPLAFVDDLSAASPPKAEHKDHGERKEKLKGHDHDVPTTQGKSLTIVHKTFQDRLLVLKNQRATTTEGLSHTLDAGDIQGISTAVLAYYRRGDAVRDDAMAITFTSDWKLVGVTQEGKEMILYEGVIRGGVRDHLSGLKPSPEIAKVKNEITPSTLPTFSFAAVERRMGVKESGTYRLKMIIFTDMTAIVKNKGKGSNRGEAESFALEVAVRGGKRERITLTFPYTTITASVKR